MGTFPQEIIALQQEFVYIFLENGRITVEKVGQMGYNEPKEVRYPCIQECM